MSHDHIMNRHASRAVFAADIGGSFIRLGYSSEPGIIRQLEKVPTPSDDWESFVTALSEMLKRNDQLNEKTVDKAPLALSIAGLIDPVDGASFSANIACINGHRLEQELSLRLGRRVVAANDADSLALAEATEGAGLGHNVVFCAILGTGVGGGLVTNGQLVRGAGGMTGEWGHGPVLNTMLELAEFDLENVDTPCYIPRFECGCGQKGCVDTIGGARGLERLHQYLHNIESNSRTILQNWHENDAQAKLTVCAYLELIADPLSVVVNTTGASIIPVGGGLAADKRLIQALDQAVRSRILRPTEHPLIVPAKFHSDGGLIGAAILGRQNDKTA